MEVNSHAAMLVGPMLVESSRGDDKWGVLVKFGNLGRSGKVENWYVMQGSFVNVLTRTFEFSFNLWASSI